MKKDTVSYSDFAHLDMRIGVVLSAKTVEDSDKLIALQVDLGDAYGHVEILAGVRQWYVPEDLIGKKMVFLANLEPKSMAGHTSQGMMLAVMQDDRAMLVEVGKELAVGSSLC